jgi:RHS repeat-associated protein
VADHLGSTSITTNADGTLSSEIRYSAFGEARYAAGITPTDYRYTGQLAQRDIKLMWYNSRWYDSYLNRFVQPDTIIPNPGSAQSWDRFAYVYNNPIRFNDPSGHDRDCGIGDYYCDELRREYSYSNWQKHLPFENFIRGKEAYVYYHKYPEVAFDDMYVGEESDSVLWARIYSEDVLHRMFEPIPEFMVLDRMDVAREEQDIELFFAIFVGLSIQERMTSDKGFGGGSFTGESTGRTIPRNLREKLAMEEAISHPGMGNQTKLTLGDTRWPPEEGWVKMSIYHGDFEIHYNFNQITGEVADYKFKTIK